MESLSEEDAEAALALMEDALGDPTVRRLNEAPPEDEEISSEEEAAVQEARDELAAGAATIPLDEVKREGEQGDDWGDLDEQMDAAMRDSLRELDEEERKAGVEPWRP